jgi:flagellar M-ring protein FliF
MEGGRLKRLSVAVLVDGVYARGAGGETTYQPRPQEELDRIAALVRTAIGFDRNRGDQVEIVNLRFAEAPAAIEMRDESLLSSLLSPTRADALHLIEIAVIALLTLMVLFAVVRPLLARVVRPETAGPPGLLGPPNTVAVGGAPEPAALPSGGTARLLEGAKLSSQAHAESLERIGEMVKTNPQETVAVLRHWLHER